MESDGNEMIMSSKIATITEETQSNDWIDIIIKNQYGNKSVV